MHKKAYLFICLFLSSCGTQDLISAKPSLSAQIPKVVDIKPKDNETIKPNSSVSIKFSKPVATISINRTNLIVAEDFQDMPSKTLEEAINDGSLACIDGEYQISEDKLIVDFHPQNGFAAGKTYGVIVTRNVLSEENLTISATVVSKFVVESANEGSSTATATSSNVATDTQQDEDVLTPAQKEPVTVVINELFYDAVGSDTDGNLFVELSGTANGDISGYKVVFINGDDGKTSEAVTFPGEAIIPSDGLYVIADAKTGSADATNVATYDLIANFDPQNGPDSVQLLDADGQLVDAVCYGNVAVKIAENGLAMCEGEPAPDVASGQSISRAPSVEDAGDNLADFIVGQSPSPGVY